MAVKGYVHKKRGEVEKVKLISGHNVRFINLGLRSTLAGSVVM